MSFRHLFVAAAIATTSLAFGAAPPATPVGSAVAPPCDRACMTGFVDRYLAAVVRHDPAGLQLNRDVKFTENAPASRWGVKACGSQLLGGYSSSMQAGELFRIDRGRITAVEAMGASLPYGTKSGWGE